MKKAFSLIELSVVILIIGILIAGVTQSSRLVQEFKLSSARNLTESSPVASIKDLALWLETTSEKSFLEQETEDGGPISTWNSISPQTTSNISFVQNTFGSRPEYDDASIGGLPSLSFDGVDDYFEKEYLSVLNPQEFTVFAVFMPKSFDDYGAIFSSRSSSGDLKGYILYVHSSAAGIPNSILLWMGVGGVWREDYNPISATLNTPYLVSQVKNSTTLSSYNSGSFIGAETENNFLVNTTNNFRIGAGRNESTPLFFLNGNIGELIIFSRALRNEERQEVEKYLSKKWGVKLI